MEYANGSAAAPRHSGIMKLIRLEKTLPDNRVTRYHRVTELVFGQTPNIMKVLVGSWPTAELAMNQTRPDEINAIEMSYPGTMETAAENLLERIILVPGWEGAIVVDASVLDATPQPSTNELPEVL
jgi:hypothetical protein